MKKIVYISATRNARAHQLELCKSIDDQVNVNWQHVIIDDASDPDKRVDPECCIDPRRRYVMNEQRRHALCNIVTVAREYQDDPDVIIATVDGDDELCNVHATDIVLEAYASDPEVDVVWTAHKWDVNEKLNVSRAMPDVVDPYEWPWSTSHLRTFRATLLKDVSDANFLDADGEWFRRGYDQILMLPILKVGKKRKYVDEICYNYRLDSASIPLDQRGGTEVEQIHNISYVRARGFVSG